MSIIECRKVNKVKQTSYFTKFARNVTSQHGEDGILDELYSLIGLPENPFCVGNELNKPIVN